MLDTIAVRPDERFSSDSVAGFLEASGVGTFDALEVEQFPAGQSNLTYLLRSGAWEAVLRRPPLGPIPPRAHDMAREFHLLSRLHPVFPLAPRPYVLCEDASVIGAPFYVMERRRGLVLDMEFPPGWQPDDQVHAGIAESLVRTLAELHAVDWRAAGLADIGRPDGYMQRQVGGWIDRYRRARTEEVPELEPLAGWFDDHVPASPAQAATVIHNDFKLNNVLLDLDDPRRLTAVLDWEMATVGDPLSDVASLLVYWTEPGEAEMMGGLRSVTAEAGFPRRSEIAGMYARFSGRDLSDLDFYVAFAYFRLAVICQQIYFRWFKGQTHDARFSGHAAVARSLIGRAAELAGLNSEGPRADCR
ncbi:MAG: phosphotransferase family protein [Chloroflexi bacterium]|nr:phosphotransferase family protein [Chloroflexota bacterium]